MRTTIEMKPDHRTRMMDIAASRGEKGFSNVVAEAVELYLERESSRVAAIEAALSLRGSMTPAESDSMMDEVRKVRAAWR